METENVNKTVEAGPRRASADGYAPDGRPMQITLSKPTQCCGSRLIIQCDGTFRCPCGRRQERAAKASICSGMLAHNGQAHPTAAKATVGGTENL